MERHSQTSPRYGTTNRQGRTSRVRPARLGIGMLALALLAGGCTSDPAPDATPLIDESTAVFLSESCELPDLTVRPPHRGGWAPAPATIDGLSVLARSEGTDLLLSTEGGDAPFVAGVNLGPTIPGFQPGEVAIRREDFRRWFPMMVEQGYRAVRIYSIQPPSFYEELRNYNLDNPTQPLYLVHGAWIPEERFTTERDLFAPGLQQEFFDEISDAVSVVFGNADLPERRGHASGSYRADVSPWTYAWIIGVEWDPPATRDNDVANAGMTPFVGERFRAAEGATPAENWIAGAVDHTAEELASRGVAVPIGFVNWPTTDPLEHPDEPLETEDLISVDANNVIPTNWPAGTFASYHAYPYYPDFQRYEAGIADCAFRGKPDAYAGYLVKLRKHHADMPVLVTEFGVPSAWGSAHSGPQGRDQGGHSEREAMTINAEMMETIHALGLSGGYVFQWVDEWFKFTWNTIDYELPSDRRQLWMNTWTNEAHFGVVAVEPGPALDVIIDGQNDDWGPGTSQVIHESRNHIREIRLRHDEGYIYLGLTLDEPLEDQRIAIGLDVLPADSGGLPEMDNAMASADYVALIDGSGQSEVLVAGHADVYRRTYGLLRGYFDVDPDDVEPGSRSWAPHQLITNRPLVIPSTGEAFPVETFPAGLLRRGTSNPDDPAFDSRVAWETNDTFVEIRLPHFAVGISDPSSQNAFAVNDEGVTSAVPFERVGIELVFEPVAGDEPIEIVTTPGYSWEPWQRPTWHERVKDGTDDVLAEVNRNLMGD